MTTDILTHETTIDLSVATFQQECERYLRSGDYFLNIVAKDATTAEKVYMIKSKLLAREGQQKIDSLFPKSTVQVVINPAQSLALTWKTMGMAEQEALQELNIQFLSYFAKSAGPSLGLPSITITGPDKLQTSAVPILYDYTMLKQALLDSLFPSFLQARIEEQQEAMKMSAVLPEPTPL